MTHKDYELLATALHNVMPEFSATKERLQWSITVNSILRKLEQTYPNFDEDKFRTMCVG